MDDGDDALRVSNPTPEQIRVHNYVHSDLTSASDLLRGQHQLTHDDLIDMWQKAKAMPEPDRTKAIRQITHLSKRLESKPAELVVNILLEVV
jgi:hypothetical protein